MTPLFVYDIETYPNVFTCGIERFDTGEYWEFELSDRRDNLHEFIQMITYTASVGGRMVGFNNENFDYPVIHLVHLLMTTRGSVSVGEIYAKAQAIIDSDWSDWSHNIWPSDRVVPQIDLFKIMHFDNVARSTSLKKLEMARRSKTVMDLPFKPGTVLTVDQIPTLLAYQRWDVSETRGFLADVIDRIEFRDKLTERYGADFTNFNDTKIGKQHFINQLEQAGVQCFDRASGRKIPRQTPRLDGIRVVDRLISVPFETEPLQQMWQFFAGSIIPADKTKGFFTDLHCQIGTLTAHFGSGGIHASVNRRTFRRSDTHKIIDVDVTSYYPSLAIVNGFYPEHLSSAFCDIYKGLFEERTSYPKGTAENAMLKLALNGVYGDSNNKFSPFLDPAYTMAITINGQLLLAWLAEMVAKIPGAELIQINTDGLTVHLPNESEQALHNVCRYWESHTRLGLESVEYEAMHIRDVNNYIAIDVNGKVKRKNAYLTEPDWHQDHGSLVVPKAVDAFVREGTRPVDFIYRHTDAYDFMRHIKVPRTSRLVWGDTEVQNTSRYFISLTGEPLTKIMPPIKPGDAERRIGVDVGWRTQMCNHVDQFDWYNLNRRWYVIEAEKLVEGLGLTVPV